MRALSKLVSSLPLAGKFLIRVLVFWFYNSETMEERREYYVALMTVLAVFILAHTFQFLDGVKASGCCAPMWATMLFVVYSVVNLLAALAQIYLASRTIRAYHNVHLRNRSRKLKGFSPIEVVVAFVVTLGGQIAYISVFAHYR